MSILLEFLNSASRRRLADAKELLARFFKDLESELMASERGRYSASERWLRTQQRHFRVHSRQISLSRRERTREGELSATGVQRASDRGAILDHERNPF